MNIPQCVIECKNPDLQSKAIAIFTRGSYEQKINVLKEVMIGNENKIPEHVPQREEEIKNWIHHISTNLNRDI